MYTLPRDWQGRAGDGNQVHSPQGEQAPSHPLTPPLSYTAIAAPAVLVTLTVLARVPPAPPTPICIQSIGTSILLAGLAPPGVSGISTLDLPVGVALLSLSLPSPSSVSNIIALGQACKVIRQAELGKAISLYYGGRVSRGGGGSSEFEGGREEGGRADDVHEAGLAKGPSVWAAAGWGQVRRVHPL
jgi:hypothetical protein